jgi:hypothetical protein
MPTTLPSPDEMLRAAATWSRGKKRTSRDARKPFIPLITRLHAEKWNATEITEKVLAQGWIGKDEKHAFYRWTCRQLETLDAGGTLS